MAAIELEEDIVSQFDNLIRWYEKLLDYNGPEENLKVISNYIENQQKHGTQFFRKSNCDRFRFSLDNTYEDIKKLHSSYKDLIQKSSVEFLNFVIQFKNAVQTAEIAVNSRSEDDLIQRNETLLQDNFAKELLDRDGHDKQKRLELELEKTNEECWRLKARLEAAEELLQAEKSLREQVEIERDSLTCLSLKLRLVFLKYEQHFSSTDRIIVINALTNGKSTTELDSIADYESEDTDWVLEVSPSPSKSIVNDEIRDLDVVLENCYSSVRAQCSSAGSSLVSSESSQSPSAVNGKRSYNTRGSKKKKKLINATSLTRRNVRSQTVDNFLPQHEKDSNLRCDICNRHYSTKSNLSYHKRLVHERIKPPKPHKCNKCNKSFTIMRDLKHHQLVHTTQKPFQCSICNHSFKYSTSKIRHERTIHGDGGVYCAYCNRKFPHKQHLVGHISTQHLPALEKPFKCSTCDKSFIHKGDFNRHQVVHILERSYKCCICEMCFKSRDRKLQHERIMHAELLRFGCAHCEKRCRRKDHLLRHIQKSHL